MIITEEREVPDYIAEDTEKGLRLELYSDTALNPREMSDYLGTMICFHDKYELGDKHQFRSPTRFLEDLVGDILPDRYVEFDAYSENKLVEMLLKSKQIIMLPLYTYEHGGITLKVGNGMYENGYTGWDWSTVGVIYATHAKIREWMMVKRVSKKMREHVIRILKEEVKEFDQYLQGEVYGFKLLDTKKDEQIEIGYETGPFYGDDWEENGLSSELGEYGYLTKLLERNH